MGLLGNVKTDKVRKIMVIKKITTSPEPCTEAGWTAFQYHLDQPVSREFILSLRPLGSLVFLDMLAQPFFKIEAHHYMIKGLLNDTSIRVAVHRDHLDELEAIKQLIKCGHRCSRTSGQL